MLKLLGIEIPVNVVIGNGFSLPHWGYGVVIHPDTIIGNNVKIYQGITIGRADVYRKIEKSSFEKIIIEDNVIIGAGAKILSNKKCLTVKRGTIVGANAVITRSTGENEIWVCNPATLKKER